jgi:hypothetical protein
MERDQHCAEPAQRYARQLTFALEEMFLALEGTSLSVFAGHRAAVRRDALLRSEVASTAWADEWGPGADHSIVSCKTYLANPEMPAQL